MTDDDAPITTEELDDFIVAWTEHQNGTGDGFLAEIQASISPDRFDELHCAASMAMEHEDA